jgi:integrase
MPVNSSLKSDSFTGEWRKAKLSLIPRFCSSAVFYWDRRKPKMGVLNLHTQSQNHPRLGAKIKTQPIRRREDVKAIKQLLADQARNYALFVLGINSALRPEDLRNIRVGQVRGLKPGDSFEVREQKTGKYRRVGINKGVHKAIQRLLATREDWDDDDFLLQSRKRGRLEVSTITALVKGWCRAINLPGNYGGSSMRKTFGYHQRVYYGVGTAILVTIFNHNSERQTLAYMG